ncbi:MAG: restriction endonuclease, SacI family [Pseudomonadota bacterium]
MKIDKKLAESLIRKVHEQSKSQEVESPWVQKVEELSRLCAEGVSSTHIAFLATSILAKAVNKKADLFAIKPNHARDNPNTYSARSLCHSVWVPLSAELGINLGVTGREPLNNQPYFRMTRLDDGTPVHAGARAAFDYMVSLVRELDQANSDAIAKEALLSFVAVRQQYQPKYDDLDSDVSVSATQLAKCIETFVKENSENGKRAQAVVAGLMDIFAGNERVESGRINDPSRKYPGDVCIRSSNAPDAWEKAIEVRDKPVAESDVHIFGKKCIDLGVQEACIVAISEKQKPLNNITLSEWGESFGIGVTLYQNWDQFIEQALFWSTLAKPIAAQNAIQTIKNRLIEVEVSPHSVRLWLDLVGGSKG